MSNSQTKKNTKKESDVKTLSFVFDFDTIYDEMTVADMIGIQRVIPDVCLNFLKKYVSDGAGGVLSEDVGFVVVSQMSVQELYNAADAFIKNVNKHAINPTKRTNSNDS